MAGLLKGLEKLGLKNLDNLNLYEEEKEKEQEVKREEVKVKEEEVPQDKKRIICFPKPTTVRYVEKNLRILP